MSTAHRQKLTKVFKLSMDNLTRELLTEIEILVYTAKAFVDSPEKEEHLDAAFENVRNRIFDLAGDEWRRLIRYLSTWEVKQVSKELDWIEFGDRLRD